jgi:hypothetical protein
MATPFAASTTGDHSRLPVPIGRVKASPWFVRRSHSPTLPCASTVSRSANEPCRARQCMVHSRHWAATASCHACAARCSASATDRRRRLVPRSCTAAPATDASRPTAANSAISGWPISAATTVAAAQATAAGTSVPATPVWSRSDGGCDVLAGAGAPATAMGDHCGAARGARTIVPGSAPVGVAVDPAVLGVMRRVLAPTSMLSTPHRMGSRPASWRTCQRSSSRSRRRWNGSRDESAQRIAAWGALPTRWVPAARRRLAPASGPAIQHTCHVVMPE